MTHARTTAFRRPGSIRLALAALGALLALLCAVRPAMAQGRRGPLLILGLRAPDGDDEAAANATNALRRAARNAGFEVPNSAPALEQSMAAFGCDDSLPADCLAQIAGDLHAERMVYGSVRRQGRGRDAQMRIEVALYDHSTHTTSARDQVTVGRAVANDADALATSARRMIDDLVPPPPPVTSGTGTGTGTGTGEGNSQVVTPPVTPPPGRPTPVRRYVGLAVMGVGVVAFAVGLVFGIQFWSMQATSAQVSREALMGGPLTTTDMRWQQWVNYNPYTMPVNMPMDANTACSSARTARMMGTMSEPVASVASICDDADTNLRAWLIGSITGGVLFTTGLILALTDNTSAPPAANEQRNGARRRGPPAFAFTPILSPQYQGATLTLRF